MIIAGAKSAQNNPALVGFAVAISVLQEKQFRALAHISAAIAQFDSGGDHQAIREDRGLTATTLAGGIFENKDFIIRDLPRLNLRINGATDDPQPSASIESDLDRLDDPLLLRGEQIDLEPIGHLERSFF